MTVQHMIVGLPKSGKTTYLAALWHLINAGEIKTKLVLEKLVGDTHYLDTISAAWRRCEPVPRTSMQKEQSMEMHVRPAGASAASVLVFPDLSGESFRRQVNLRRCRQSYFDACESAKGLLLFVTANRGQDDLTIVELNRAIGEEPKPPAIEPAPEQPTQSATAAAGSGLATAPKKIDWTPELIPDQVRLIELLQFLQDRPFTPRRRRLAVIISAWDTVRNAQLTPEKWLEREMPGLRQFLSSNSEAFEPRYYGVSAQGGSLKQRDHLLKQTPSSRLTCIGPDTDLHDLTSPIVWLLAA